MRSVVVGVVFGVTLFISALNLLHYFELEIFWLIVYGILFSVSIIVLGFGIGGPLLGVVIGGIILSLVGIFANFIVGTIFIMLGIIVSFIVIDIDDFSTDTRWAYVKSAISTIFLMSILYFYILPNLQQFNPSSTSPSQARTSVLVKDTPTPNTPIISILEPSTQNNNQSIPSTTPTVSSVEIIVRDSLFQFVVATLLSVISLGLGWLQLRNSK